MVVMRTASMGRCCCSLMFLLLSSFHRFNDNSGWTTSAFILHGDGCRLPATTWFGIESQQPTSDGRLPLLLASEPSHQGSSSSTEDKTMVRASDIKRTLKEMGVDCTDCFDRESLLQRLHDSRSGSSRGDGTTRTAFTEKTATKNDAAETTKTYTQQHRSSTESRQSSTSSGRTSGSSNGVGNKIDSDDKDLLQPVRSMSIKELREELARRRIRWAGLLDKDDLIRAVVQAREQAANFSCTGKVTPGQVADLTGDELDLEINDAAHDAPVLVDAYATWCGPCQLLARHLIDVAGELQDRVRVVKLDTDQHPAKASALRVQGLPTLILFRYGKEMDRIEGALTREQLLRWVEERTESTRV
jgi:thioredoxin